MVNQKSETIGFFILLGLATLVALILFWPFWQLLAFAVILTILFHPIYLRTLRWVKNGNLASGLVVLIIALIIAGPVLLIGQQLFFELAELYNNLNSINVQDLVSRYAALIARLPVPAQNLAFGFNADFHSWVSQSASQVFLSLSGIISRLGWFFGSLVVLAFSIFFLLRDGDKLKKQLVDLLPLSQTHEGILFNRISEAVNGVVKGQFLVSLTEATVSFIGFSIFGVPKALLWACVLLISSFVPTFGTSLVLVPVVVYLFMAGHVGAAIGMTIWGWASVILIDNVLSAKIVSGRVRLHPLLTIFGILGGVVVFGIFGLLLGPILMAIFVALVDIYIKDIKKA